ncbi:hypothetical protein M0802_002588 [Mischocyttarus mexicanus]|nr:hypothetical protein M0802_002588 [Mischocyttarus mexicanus]
MNRLKVSLLFLWSSLIVLESLSTKELLECHENLSAAIRNDTVFLKKVHQAEYIFTGKMKELRKGQLHIRVKRSIKGTLNGTLELALNDTCSLYIRRSYTGIFMARHEQGLDQHRKSGKIVMHFGPVPLTLVNLDRLNAAVRVLLSVWLSLSLDRVRRSTVTLYRVLLVIHRREVERWISRLADKPTDRQVNIHITNSQLGNNRSI